MITKWIPAWLGVLLSILVLHLSTSLRFWWESADPELEWSSALMQGWSLLSPDLVVLLAAGCVVSLQIGYRWFIGHLVVAGVVWVLLFHLGDSIVLAFQGQPFLLHRDVFQVPGLWVYLTDQTFDTRTQFAVVGVVLGVPVCWALLYFCVRSVLRGSVRSRLGLWLLIACQGVAVAAWLEFTASPATASRFVGPSMLARTLAQAREMLAAEPWNAAEVLAERSRLARVEQANLATNLVGLQGADVYVVFAESYGRAMFRRPALAERFARRAEEWERILAESGFSSASAYATSPVAGGASKVSHTEFLTGVHLEDYVQADVMLSSDAPAMPRYFNEAGYYTLHVQPKLQLEWEDSRSFFGFQADLFGIHENYHERLGPVYHWSHAPDQFFLHSALQNHIRPSERPVFMAFVTVISHAPFSMIPPYLSDWSSAGDPTLYEPVEVYDFDLVTYLHHPEIEDAYFRTVEYTLQTLVGFAGELDRPTLFLVVGDHQPPLFVDIRTTFDVPVHVFSNRPELLEPFTGWRGFIPGLVPPPADDAVPFHMDRFLPWLLEDFSK